MNRLILRLGIGLGIAVLVAAAFGAGYVLRPWLVPEKPAARRPVKAKPKAKTLWTCSMHPQIRLPKAGLCPICNMSLIPLKAGDDAGPRTLIVSKAAEKLMDIQTSFVERRFVTAEIRMVGKIEFDETTLTYITAWVPGRLDRLFVDYTGVAVRKGDHMVYMYSPELLSAQEELIQALQAVKELEGSKIGIMRETAERTVVAVREKLRLWGLTKEQIEQIETRGVASDHITIYAPAGGIVVHKNAQQGMYVNVGTRIYTIADLNHVWVKLDAYESDLMWIRYGQRVEFATEAYPGETFIGMIAFIDPVLNAKTRTVKVRVNVPNLDGKLKPGMFVRGVVRAKVATGGRVMDPALAGKWMCRMHPEIVKDVAGKCDICEMPLERTESLGYVSVVADKAAAPLVIPVSAPLITGTRAVVYVRVKDTKKPTFEGREIVLGPRAGAHYIVKSGLEEGELVVTSGNFKIDSALQIQAKPSMMSPEGGGAPPGHRHGSMPRKAKPPGPAPKKADVPDAFRKQITGLWQAYVGVADALAKDDLKAAAEAGRGARKALDAADMNLLKGHAHMAWMKEMPSLKKATRDMTKARDIEKLRAAFALLSEEMPVVIRTFGLTSAGPVYVLKCPMAFNNRGATWLQKDKETRNPYFGAMMLKCGSVVDTIAGESDKPAEGRADE